MCLQLFFRQCITPSHSTHSPNHKYGVCCPGGRGESASYAPADEEDEQDNKTAAQEEDRRQAAAGAAARGEDPAEDEPEGSDEGEEEEADQKSTVAAKGKKSGTAYIVQRWVPGLDSYSKHSSVITHTKFHRLACEQRIVGSRDTGACFCACAISGSP